MLRSQYQHILQVETCEALRFDSIQIRIVTADSIRDLQVSTYKLHVPWLVHLSKTWFLSSGISHTSSEAIN